MAAFKENPVVEFIKNNTTMVTTYSFYNPYCGTRDTVLLIEPASLKDLITVFEEGGVDHNLWDGFVTSDYGLFLVREVDLKEESFYTLHGYKVVYPEVTIKMIEDGFLPPLTRYTTQIFSATKESIDEAIAKREKEKQKAAEAMLRYNQAKAAFCEELCSGNPLAAELANEVWHFDHYFSQTDCIQTYKAAKKQKDELSKRLTDMGFDAEEIFSRF